MREKSRDGIIKVGGSHQLIFIQNIVPLQDTQDKHSNLKSNHKKT